MQKRTITIQYPGQKEKATGSPFLDSFIHERRSQGLNYPFDASSTHARGQSYKTAKGHSCFGFRQHCLVCCEGREQGLYGEGLGKGLLSTSGHEHSHSKVDFREGLREQ